MLCASPGLTDLESRGLAVQVLRNLIYQRIFHCEVHFVPVSRTNISKVGVCVFGSVFLSHDADLHVFMSQGGFLGDLNLEAYIMYNVW